MTTYHVPSGETGAEISPWVPVESAGPAATPDAPTPPRVLTADEMNAWADGVMTQVTAARREAQELRVKLSQARSALAWLLANAKLGDRERHVLVRGLGRTATKRGGRGKRD